MSVTTYVVLFSMATILTVETQSAYLRKNVDPFIKSGITDPKKRPFCNAFTGCGRKRSNLPALTRQGEPVEETIGSLLELNAEPAVEDLQRQILSEAKMWEAIQEANMELARRKQDSSESDENESAVLSKSASSSCTVPPCYI